MMNIFSKHLTTGALAIATTSIAIGSFASSANAMIFTVSGGSGPCIGNLSGLPGLESTEIDQTCVLKKFDNSLGTLVSAKLTLGGDFLQDFSVRNRAAQTQRARVSTSVELNFDIPGVTLSTPNNGAPSITFGATTGLQTYAPGQTKFFGPFSDSQTVDYFFPSNASLGFFNDAGKPFNVNCDSLSGLTVLGGGGNLDIVQNTKAGCKAAIEYTYRLEIPEPNMAFGILGIAGLGLFLKRKTSKSDSDQD